MISPAALGDIANVLYLVGSLCFVVGTVLNMVK